MCELLLKQSSSQITAQITAQRHKTCEHVQNYKCSLISEYFQLDVVFKGAGFTDQCQVLLIRFNTKVMINIFVSKAKSMKMIDLDKWKKKKLHQSLY